VTLVVNGENVGTETPDAVNVVTWSGVPLREGENEVELKADGGLSARRRILRTRL
jgi:hypothetical protein